ncbi:MAG: 4Fe-4S binding protein [Firmicutes bacterium]|nr:4Fe-4S binding protein [Bacillota bacterium]
MKRVYVNEEWCLGCHLCEYNCAFANSGKPNMAVALKGKPIFPNIHVEGDDKITYAVSCRHCEDPICVRSCIAGALSKSDAGVVQIDHSRCVGCYTCLLVCPYGALAPGADGLMSKCELCLTNGLGEPACVAGCPNRAIVYEEREVI